jgi:hypothetical protein
MVSIVVMDGPFMSVDPIGRSDKHVLGNVVHAIHASNAGYDAEIPAELLPYLNRGVIPNPQHTKFDKFIETGEQFIPALRRARHIGSMYTVRTVLDNRDHDDARPTDVSRVGDKLIRIFSGKIGNCIDGARAALALI